MSTRTRLLASTATLLLLTATGGVALADPTTAAPAPAAPMAAPAGSMTTSTTTTSAAMTDPQEDPRAADVPKGEYQAGDIEAEIYGGMFINNNRHQFYDASVYSPFNTPFEGLPVRPNLDRADAEIGGRIAYFFHKNFGLEAEASNVFEYVKHVHTYAQVFGTGIQGIFQLPMHDWTPYVSLGWGLRHVSSPNSVLGSDTDWPINASIGVKYWICPRIAIRADARALLGPQEASQADPNWTLRAFMGEFTLGLTIKSKD